MTAQEIKGWVDKLCLKLTLEEVEQISSPLMGLSELLFSGWFEFRDKRGFLEDSGSIDCRFRFKGSKGG